RALGARGERFARLQAHFLLRVLQEDAQIAFQHVERVLHVVVKMPGHFLRPGEPQLLDAETGARGVLRAVLDFVEMAGVLDCFHGDLRIQILRSVIPAARRARYSASMRTAPDTTSAAPRGMLSRSSGRPHCSSSANALRP